MPMDLLHLLSQTPLPVQVVEPHAIYKLHVLRVAGHVFASIPSPQCAIDGRWHQDQRRCIVCGTRMARDVRPLMSWTFRHLDSAAGFVNQQLERPGRSLVHLLEVGSILFVATGLDDPIVYRRAVGTWV